MATIRAATESDIPKVLELYRQLTITTSPAELHASINFDNYKRAFAQIQTFTGYELLVAEEDGEVVGTMVLLIVPNLSHAALPWAVIENMVVDESYRRKGIGKQLMDYAAVRAKEAGCYKVQLLSNKRRGEAHQFYESIGYKATADGFRMYL